MFSVTPYHQALEVTTVVSNYPLKYPFFLYTLSSSGSSVLRQEFILVDELVNVIPLSDADLGLLQRPRWSALRY